MKQIRLLKQARVSEELFLGGDEALKNDFDYGRDVILESYDSQLALPYKKYELTDLSRMNAHITEA